MTGLLLLTGCMHTVYLGPVRAEPSPPDATSRATAVLVLDEGKLPARIGDRARGFDFELLQADRHLRDALSATFATYFRRVELSGTADLPDHDVSLHPHLSVDLWSGGWTVVCDITFRVTARDHEGVELAQAHADVEKSTLFVGTTERACRDALDQAYRSVIGEIFGHFATHPPPRAPAADGAEYVDLASLQVVERAFPSYPEEALPLGIPEASCELDVRVGVDGIPIDATPDADCHELFAAAGREALLQWRFAPPERLVVVPIGVTFRVSGLPDAGATPTPGGTSSIAIEAAPPDGAAPSSEPAPPSEAPSAASPATE